MKNRNKDENYIDFGEWLFNLRKEKGFTEEELVDKINMINVKEINIKKWERDLEFPDLDAIYKLSEIYMIPSEEIIDKKQKTLQNGVEGIHIYIIRVLSLLMGTSIYGTIWLFRIVLYSILILVTIWFYLITLSVRN